MLPLSCFCGVRAPTDFLFTIFVSSLYRSSATFKLLRQFGFVRSRLCCTHSSHHRHKIDNISRRLMQIPKRQRDPCYSLSPFCCMALQLTHPPILSDLLLILSASRFLAPDFPLLVPAPFLPLIHQHGMTFPFL